MSKVAITGNASGAGVFTIASPDSATDRTLTMLDGTGTLALFGTGTAVASTSGTSIDFTGIPSWVKRVTILLNTVSTTGGAALLIQIGPSGGIETTGYDSIAGTVTNTNNTTRGAGSSIGYLLSGSPAGAAGVPSGVITLVNISSNIWVESGTMADSTAVGPGVTTTGGTKALAGTLTQVRVTTTNGTDTFDAGSINIMYE